MPRDEQATRALTASTPRGAPTVSGYQVLRELGRGGMGVVYEARQSRLGRRVALKVVDLLRASGDDDYLAARLGDEARALARLNHPNLVQVYDAGDADGRLWVALELVDGVDAAAWLHDRGPFAVAAALAVVLDAARGLAHVHAAGLVHRDVKPSNLLLAPAGSGDGRSFPWIAKVADLGLARAAAGRGEATSSGLIVGSPAYMAPEQADGREVDHRTDVYALGATLFHLLTGKVPFGGGTPAEVLWQKHGTPIPDPTPLVPGAPAGLGRVLDRMLARSPAERYGSDADLVADLEALLAGRDPAATWVPREDSSLQRAQAVERATTRAWRAMRVAPGRPWLGLTAGLILIGALTATAAKVSRSTRTLDSAADEPLPVRTLALDPRSAPPATAAATPASVETSAPPSAAVDPRVTASSVDSTTMDGAPLSVRLALVSVPTASLLVDAAWVGTGSWSGTVARGMHVVEALAPGHDPARVEVQLDADRSVNLAPTPVQPRRRLLASPDHAAPVWNPRRAVLDQWRIVSGAWRADPAVAGLTGVAEGSRASAARTSLGKALTRGRLGDAWRLEWQLSVPTGAVAEVQLDLGAESRVVLVVEERAVTLVTRAPGRTDRLVAREVFVSSPGFYRLDWDGEVVVAAAGNTHVGAVRITSRAGAPELELAIRGGEATFASLELVGLRPVD